MVGIYKISLQRLGKVIRYICIWDWVKRLLDFQNGIFKIVASV